MNYFEKIIPKYFEILNKQDYDSKISSDVSGLDGIGTIEDFNNALESVISQMSHDDMVKTLKQAFKCGISDDVGESDGIIDELHEWIIEEKVHEGGA